MRQVKGCSESAAETSKIWPDIRKVKGLFSSMAFWGREGASPALSSVSVREMEKGHSESTEKDKNKLFYPLYSMVTSSPEFCRIYCSCNAAFYHGFPCVQK